MTYLLVALAALAVGLRLTGTASLAFQAAAHLLVGGLFGAYCVTRRSVYFWILLALAAAEIVIAAVTLPPPA